jgi:hypothetical protein
MMGRTLRSQGRHPQGLTRHPPGHTPQDHQPPMILPTHHKTRWVAPHLSLCSLHHQVMPHQVKVNLGMGHPLLASLDMGHLPLDNLDMVHLPLDNKVTVLPLQDSQATVLPLQDSQCSQGMVNKVNQASPVMASPM